MQVAISLKGEAFIGRNLHEGDLLYVYIEPEEAKYLLEKYKEEFNEEEIEYLQKIIKNKLFQQ
jgi:translation initiation factor 5B